MITDGKTDTTMADRRRDDLESPVVAANAKTDVVDALNHLFNICRVSSDTYRQAAEHVENEGLRSKLQVYAQHRATLGVQLANTLADLGREPQSDAAVEVVGALHQLWLDVKAAATQGDEHAILVECERAEDATLKAYAEALKAPLSREVRDLLATQRQELRNAHDHIREMRDMAA
jgi:uncharacterized protein (TIGR02284 family)